MEPHRRARLRERQRWAYPHLCVGRPCVRRHGRRRLTERDPSRISDVSPGRPAVPNLRTNSVPENSGVYVGSLDAKPDEQDSKRLVATMFSPSTCPLSEGAGTCYLRDGNILAYPFDEGRLALAGDPVIVVEEVGAWRLPASFLRRYVLMYRSSAANQNTRLQWWAREGTFANTPEQPGGVNSMALSPDARVALVRADPTSPNGELWIWDTARGNSARLRSGPGRVESPVWTPDGLQIIFSSNHEGSRNLYRKLLNVSNEDDMLLKSSRDKTPTSLSADGRFPLFTQTDPQTKQDIWVLSNPAGVSGDRKAMPFQRGEFDESEAQFSPRVEDGPSSGPRWVAYTSNESGRNEVYVREFPLNGAAGNWLVSRAGGTNPRWRKDGKELFFAAPDGNVMSVDVTPGATFQASEPRLLVRGLRHPSQLGRHVGRKALSGARERSAGCAVHRVAELAGHAQAVSSESSGRSVGV